MASCDDEFTLITDDTSTHQPNPNFHHHHHHHFSAPPPSRPPPEAILQSNGDGYTDDAFNSQPLVVVTYENESDPNRSAVSGARNDKRSDREELSDGGTPYSYNKKVKIASNSSDYRKDREEWSDAAIACLLDAYLEKFVQLNRGNLRVRDWEEVATAVSERCENQSKSMEDIVGNSLPVKSAVDDDKCVGGLNASGRQSKRYMTATSSGSGQITNMEAKSVTSPRWRRVVFKISGAALAGTGSQSTDPKVAMLIAREVSLACQMGIEVAIVVGGRNFFCGDSWVAATDSDRSTAYQIGMMATMMNSILLQSTLEKLGVQARVQSAFCLPDVSEPYNRQRAIRHLEKGRVIIFGGVSAGTGNPLFSTDTAAALRASELHADVVIKGTNVHGMYECDNISSVAYEHISFRELASRGSSQIDKMAATFCEENSIPVVIFSLHEPGNISRALSGENIGTLIDQTGRIG
ncbi:putative UMP kinase transcription factor Trihelix family [Helianthus annuus]|uniref:UMP kinase n=1 Tax=Helianthus annuus TaxID=4232 RepID=A0A9K3EH68_HELAN|nr:putative UMP kinase transcription factor Trihelix family [Helianthus annuus]